MKVLIKYFINTLTPALVMLMLVSGCKNEDFPDTTKPEIDYVILVANGEYVDLKLNKTGLQYITMEPITPDEDAEVFYYDKNGKPVLVTDFEDVASVVLTNHRFSFSVNIGEESMRLEAVESTYFESYYLRILFYYKSVTEKIEVRVEPGYSLDLRTISYDFENALVTEFTEDQVRETFTNESDNNVSFSYKPYEGVSGKALFLPKVTWIDGMGYHLGIPKYSDGEWSRTDKETVYILFGEEVSYMPRNIDSSLEIPVVVSPRSKLTIDCSITYSRIELPFHVEFQRPNTGLKEETDGTVTFTVPANYNISFN